MTTFLLGPDEAGIVPMFEAGYDPQRFIRFRQWWHVDQPVLYNDLRCSREFLVTEVANTDGLHIDALVDAEYSQMTQPLPDITMSTPTLGPLPATGVVAAAMRQIAWEVERTLAAH